MAFLWVALALIGGIIFLFFFFIMVLLVMSVVFDVSGGDRYEMDEETFDRIKEDQYLQMVNLFGTNL